MRKWVLVVGVTGCLVVNINCIEVADLARQLIDSANATASDNPTSDEATDSSGDSDAMTDEPMVEEPLIDTGPSRPTDGTDTSDPAADSGDSATEEEPATADESASTDDADEGGLPPLPDGAELTTSDTGLRFFDYEVGDGAMPTADSTVRVDYVGYLDDGTIFDQNDSGRFPIGGVIDGFAEGLLGMNVGGRRRLVIPPDLGYGPSGNAGAGIGGDDTIIFDVTLLEVE